MLVQASSPPSPPPPAFREIELSDGSDPVEQVRGATLVLDGAEHLEDSHSS